MSETDSRSISPRRRIGPRSVPDALLLLPPGLDPLLPALLTLPVHGFLFRLVLFGRFLLGLAGHGVSFPFVDPLT